MGMEWVEWCGFTAKLNLSYPHQQIPDGTGREWFAALEGFPAGEVWEAIDRVRREDQWMPTLARILEAIDLNWREAAAKVREEAATAIRSRRNARGGVPAPPEYTEARKLLERTKLPPYHADHLDSVEGRRQIEVCSARLEARIDREKREAFSFD